MSNNFAPFLAILHANYTFAFNATLFLLKHNMLFFNSMYTVCSDVLLALFQLVRVHQYPSYCSRLLVGWQRDIHEFDLEPRQCYVRSTKTLTKPFTCWSKGYSCNFANQVSHSFFLVRWEKRIEHLACEDAIPDVVFLFYLGL